MIEDADGIFKAQQALYERVYANHKDYGAHGHYKAHAGTLAVMVKHKTVLDIGCGDGAFCKYAKINGAAAVFGLDIASPREEMEIKGWYYFCTSTHHLPFDDNTTDLITAFDVLEHIPERQLPLVMSEIKRVASKTGKAFFTIATHPCSKMVDNREEELHATVMTSAKWVQMLTEFGSIQLIGHPQSNRFTVQMKL